MIMTEETNKFCSNPKCEYHIEAPYNALKDNRLNVYGKNEIKAIHRFEYKYRTENRASMFFCEVCHNAITQVMINAN